MSEVPWWEVFQQACLVLQSVILLIAVYRLT